MSIYESSISSYIGIWTHLLGIKTNDKGWSVHYLSSNTDVPLADEYTSMMDTLCQTSLEDLGLQSPLQEILNFQGQDVIQPHAGLIEHTNTNQTTDERISFEETLGILSFELE